MNLQMRERRTLGQQRVKIVGTLGPASSDRRILRALIGAGLDVVRLNFSHGDHEGHGRVFELVREEAARAGSHVAVLADLCGPKIRVGEMAGGEISLVEGGSLEITTRSAIGDSRRISTSYEALPRDVAPGDRILLDDGRITLRVQETGTDAVRCEVVVGGPLRDHKGMNIPGSPLSISALTDKDRDDLAFAKQLGVDYLALSFVRRAEDVRETKALAGDTPVIAKIEKPEAILNLGAIIEAADGLMVARGDLGVEAGAEHVPLLQKRIIRDATVRGLPVIVATQMMESMIENPQPTRAEVSDVANAVIDGADAVMLSGETAVGRYPVETVKQMSKVIAEVESSDVLKPVPPVVRVEDRLFSNAIARLPGQRLQTPGDHRGPLAPPRGAAPPGAQVGRDARPLRLGPQHRGDGVAGQTGAARPPPRRPRRQHRRGLRPARDRR
jgi:pyruvate kinase